MSLIKTANEAAILSRVTKGDEEAFKELFLAYHNQLAEYVFFLTHSKEVTEEVVHDVFVKIWTNRAELLNIGKFTSYLFIVCRNYTLNILRKIARKQQADLAYKNEQLSSANIEEVDYNDFDKMLVESIDLLPNQQREVFKYRMNGVKNAEIAEIMGISTETVRKYYKIALNNVVKSVRIRNSSVDLIVFSIYFENILN